MGNTQQATDFLEDEIRYLREKVAELQAELKRYRMAELANEATIQHLRDALSQAENSDARGTVCPCCQRVRAADGFWLSPQELVQRYLSQAPHPTTCPQCRAALEQTLATLWQRPMVQGGDL